MRQPCSSSNYTRQTCRTLISVCFLFGCLCWANALILGGILMNNPGAVKALGASDQRMNSALCSTQLPMKCKLHSLWQKVRILNLIRARFICMKRLKSPPLSSKSHSQHHVKPCRTFLIAKPLVLPMQHIQMGCHFILAMVIWYLEQIMVLDI